MFSISCRRRSESTRRSRALLAAVGIAVLVRATSTLAAPEETEVVKASAASIDQQLAGHVVINYVVLPTGELSTPEGTVVSFKNLPRHLKRTKPDKKAFFVLWIAGPEHIGLAKTAVDKLSNYGAAKFAVRQLPEAKGDPTPASPGVDHNTPSKKKSVILRGGPNPAASGVHDIPPSFENRPQHLRPGPLPHRVRCKFVSDAVVITAAENADRLFTATDPIDPALIAETVLIQPGAWKLVRKDPVFDGSKAFSSGVQLKKEVVKLEGRFLQNPKQKQAIAEKLRALTTKDGGGTIRALTSREMDEWWTFIPFDIEEPVFVLETKGGKHRFVVSFNEQGQLSLVDDLNGLPKQ